MRCNEEFNLHFKLISSSEITVGEERNHLIPLIKRRRKYLVKQLVLQMTELGVGKSKVFKSLPWFHIVQHVLNECSSDQLKLYQANSLRLCVIIVQSLLFINIVN